MNGSYLRTEATGDPTYCLWVTLAGLIVSTATSFDAFHFLLSQFIIVVRGETLHFARCQVRRGASVGAASFFSIFAFAAVTSNHRQPTAH